MVSKYFDKPTKATPKPDVDQDTQIHVYGPQERP